MLDLVITLRSDVFTATTHRDVTSDIMDTPWTLEDWQPSALPRSGWNRANSDVGAQNMALAVRVSNPTQQFEVALGDLIRYTTAIRTSPYSPLHWLHRAKALLTLGYPELSTADAHKSVLLCQRSQDNPTAQPPNVSVFAWWLRRERQGKHCRSNHTLTPAIQQFWSDIFANKQTRSRKPRTRGMLGQRKSFNEKLHSSSLRH